MSGGQEIPEWKVAFPRSASNESLGEQFYTFYDERAAREFLKGLTWRSGWADRVRLFRRTISVTDWEETA